MCAWCVRVRHVFIFYSHRVPTVEDETHQTSLQQACLSVNIILCPASCPVVYTFSLCRGTLRRGGDAEKYTLFIHDSSHWQRGQPRSRVSDVIWQQMKGKEQSSLCSRLSEVSQLALTLVSLGAGGQGSVCVHVSAWWNKHSCGFTVSFSSPSQFLSSQPTTPAA